LGSIRVDWEVDWGVMDMMLSWIALEVAQISHHFQNGVMGHNTWSILLRLYNTVVYLAFM